MNDEDRHDRLLERARRLPGDLPPGRDLWPEIRARIGEKENGSAFGARGGRPGWASAALAASVVVAVVAVALLRSAGPDDPGMAAGGAGAPVPASPARFGPAYPLGPRYEDARTSLARDVEARLETLPPETRAAVEKNLEAIGAAVAEINAALGDDPGNVFLQQLLMDAYQHELAVLARVQRMTRTLSNRARNEI